MIFAQSRYESSRLFFASDSYGEQRRIVSFPTPSSVLNTNRRHVIREYERLDQLAARYYGDPEMWWVIAQANPEVFYPEDIEPGTVVRIPDAPTLL